MLDRPGRVHRLDIDLRQPSFDPDQRGRRHHAPVAVRGEQARRRALRGRVLRELRHADRDRPLLQRVRRRPAARQSLLRRHLEVLRVGLRAASRSRSTATASRRATSRTSTTRSTPRCSRRSTRAPRARCSTSARASRHRSTHSSGSSRLRTERELEGRPYRSPRHRQHPPPRGQHREGAADAPLGAAGDPRRRARADGPLDRGGAICRDGGPRRRNPVMPVQAARRAAGRRIGEDAEPSGRRAIAVRAGNVLVHGPAFGLGQVAHPPLAAGRGGPVRRPRPRSADPRGAAARASWLPPDADRVHGDGSTTRTGSTSSTRSCRSWARRWEVPFEFPLFQAAAAVVMDAGIAEDTALRVTGLASFVLAAWTALAARPPAGGRPGGGHRARRVRVVADWRSNGVGRPDRVPRARGSLAFALAGLRWRDRPGGVVRGRPRRSAASPRSSRSRPRPSGSRRSRCSGSGGTRDPDASLPIGGMALSIAPLRRGSRLDALRRCIKAASGGDREVDQRATSCCGTSATSPSASTPSWVRVS